MDEILSRMKDDSRESRDYRAVGFHYAAKKASHPRHCRFLGFAKPSENSIEFPCEDIGFCLEENCSAYTRLDENIVGLLSSTNLLRHKQAVGYTPILRCDRLKTNKVKRESDFLGFLNPSENIKELFEDQKVDFNMVPKKRNSEMFIEIVEGHGDDEAESSSEKENLDISNLDGDAGRKDNTVSPKSSDDDEVMEVNDSISDFERIRLKNIEERKQFLIEMGLMKVNEPEEKKIIKVKINKFNMRPKKKQYPVRRSIRLSNGTSDFLSLPYDDPESDTEQNEKAYVKRPNSYGVIKGVAVGQWWSSRLECNMAGIHRPTVAGIHPGPIGAYSVVLSGGYDDDVDNGESFTYTGSGGRDLKGTKTNPKNLRTAPQTKNQTLNLGNAALVYSCEHKKPVRVVRGYKLKSPYAPDEGYRYDGLYLIDKWWLSEGASGFLTYKFLFKRREDQDPPPWSEVSQNQDLIDTSSISSTCK